MTRFNCIIIYKLALGWVGDEGRVISYGEEEERERRKSMFYLYFIKQILIFQYLISMVFVSVKMRVMKSQWCLCQ
jgi:hypothetical protein